MKKNDDDLLDIEDISLDETQNLSDALEDVEDILAEYDEDDTEDEEDEDILLMDDSDDDYRSYDDYFNDYDMETYDQSYKTSGGEIVHAFGRYGYN